MVLEWYIQYCTASCTFLMIENVDSHEYFLPGIPIVIHIAHEIIPNVFNLSFGPLNKKGKINDKALVNHADYSKAFSTIFLSAYAYLEQHSDQMLGIDGSDNARAYFYFRALVNNDKYQNQFFDMYGVKYFVRITRLGRTQYDNPFDFRRLSHILTG